MSTQGHACAPMYARESFLPDLKISPGTVGWDLAVEGHGFQIRFCPFCGQDLEAAPKDICRADGPYGDCELKPGHDGPHMLGRSGMMTLGFQASEAPKLCLERGPRDFRCGLLPGHDGWHHAYGLDWVVADGHRFQARFGKSPSERPVMQWTYRYVHHLAEERRTIEEILNEHGQAGWELAYYKPTPSGGHDLILKRPLPSSSEGKVT